MASVYQRKDRAYLYAKIRDPKSLRWVAVKTPFRKDSPAAMRNALVWANEQDRVGKATITLTRHAGWSWVFTWLNQAFGYNRNTLLRYTTAWAHLNEYLVQHGLRAPAELLYRHASEYIAWRTRQQRACGKLIHHNTALTEVKVMSRILAEARMRELILANPWTRLGIRRQNVRHTPAMSQAEIDQWRAAAWKQEEGLPITERWMTVSFEVALLQGVRLSATSVPMKRVHLDPRTTEGINLDRITFEEKGRYGVKKIKTLPVNPSLRPLLLALQAAGAEWTCRLPTMAAALLWAFRQQNGLGHLRFHSTRATVATELTRNNVSRSKAMELLGHKSEAVHQAYLHLRAEDVADELAGMNFSTRGKAENLGGPAPKRLTPGPSTEDHP